MQTGVHVCLFHLQKTIRLIFIHERERDCFVGRFFNAHQTDGCILLTVARMSKGRLPCWSDRAPVIGDDRNCSRENSDPIKPERQIQEHANECDFFAS